MQDYASKLNLNKTELENVGLIINPKWPWVGASAYALVDSDTVQVVEVKCLSTKRYQTLISACGDKKFCAELLQWSTKIEMSASLFSSVSGYYGSN